MNNPEAEPRGILLIKKETRRFEEVIQANHLNKFLHEFERALKGNKIYNELELVLGNGGSLWAGIQYTPILNKDGICENVILYFIDLSERRRAELFREAAEQKFLQIETLKRNILTGLSHEIISPMNGITGAVELMKSKNTDTETMERAVSIISESSERLLDTVNKITNLSLLNYEKNSYPEKVIDIKEAIKETYEKYLHMANKKDLVMTISLTDEQLLVKINKTMLEIVLSNLLNNAIKYTDEGHVSIKIKKEPHSDLVNITFNDSGKGIPADSLNRIFLDFEQESFGFDRKYEGSGIGLSICKKYLVSAGGNLSVISQEHKGSTFIVSLPLV